MQRLFCRLLVLFAVLGCVTHASAAMITSLSPAYAPLAGGPTIYVSGSGFVEGDTTVLVDGTSVPATVTSSSQLTFVAPPHAEGMVDVAVQVGSDPPSNNVPGGFQYADEPTLVSLSPQNLPAAGGVTVTATGTGFIAGQTSVTVGSAQISAANVTVTSPTSLTFSSPAQDSASSGVVIRTPIGDSNLGILYFPGLPSVTSMTPAIGPAAGGTTVTVSGAGFAYSETTVTIGGTEIPATVNSSSSLTFVTPAHAAGNAAVSLTTPLGTTTDIAGGFTYADPPTASALTPTGGPVAGGTQVTVTGTGFIPGDTSVTIGGAVIPAGSVTVNSSTSLTFSTPAHAEGNVAVTVTTSGGATSNVDGGFSYVNAPVVSAISPNAGPEEGGTEVTVTGSGFTGASEVWFGGVPASFTVGDDTTLTATSPPGMGDVAVTVTATGGASASGPQATFSYQYLVPPDSVRAEQVQRELSVFVARASERAITGAVSSGIALGLSGSSSVLDVSPAGAFLAYVPQGTVTAFDDVFANPAPSSDWSMWIDVRGTGLLEEGQGRQVNLTGGVGYRATPDLVVGLVTGYEVFDYHSVAFDGDLRGDGASIGGYVGWKPDGITFDAMLVYSALGYDVSAGTASGSLDAARWLASSGISTDFRLGDGFVLTPSARLSAIWEKQEAWLDTLAASHPERQWLSGSALAGAMVTKEFALADDLIVQLRLGAFAGYRYEQDGYEGLDGRVEAGAGVTTEGGARFDVSGELGGLGTSATSWSVRGGAGAGF